MYTVFFTQKTVTLHFFRGPNFLIQLVINIFSIRNKYITINFVHLEKEEHEHAYTY